MDTLTFDIETIPQENLSDIQREELDKKLKRALTLNPDLDPEMERNKICSISPYLGEIVTIGIQLNTTDTEDAVALVGSEKEILEKFWKNIGGRNLLFISYNGLSFDVPFIVKRSMHYGIIPTNTKFLNTRRYKISPHYDVKEVISDWDRYAAPSLKLACDLVGIASPKDGEVKAENVYSAFKEGRINEIAEYCLKDLTATYQLALKLNNYLV